jgi:polar amino acid transport system substrate-binding protein
MPRSAIWRRAGVALALLGPFLAAACSSSPATTSSAASSIKTITPGVITIATYGSDPPLITVGPGANQMGGLSGDWINAFAAEYGLKVKLFQTTFASTLTAVQQGKADVGAPVYYTSERAKSYYYTYPVDVESLVVFTKSSFNYTAPSSLLGHKVGSVTGYVWTPYFQKFFGSNLLVFPTAKDAQTAFVNGQVDAYLDADLNYFSPPMSLSPTISVHSVHAGDFGIAADLVSSESYWIVNCSEKALANALDTARQKLAGQWASNLSHDGAPAGYPQQSPPLVRPAEAC